jgi:drug/metabolite transporter (DMT)-like permease
MKDLDIGTLVAVFQEMLGPWLWIGLALAAVATLAFIYVVVRDRGFVPARLVWSEVVAVAGGIAAVLIMQAVTHSGFGDIGGPIDWVLVALIFAAGAVGTTIGVYAALGLLAGNKARRMAREPGVRSAGYAPLAR